MKGVASRARRVSGMILPVLLVPALLLVPGEASPQAREYELKAAFLLSFAKFVEWPDEAFPVPGDPIVVAVAGDDPFGPTLERVVQGRTAQGREFLIRRFGRPGDLERCHILFIGASEDPDEWLEALEGRGFRAILTVGEGSDFRHRGAISFLIEGRRVRLAVNLDAVAESGLQVSSKLLAVAHIVTRRWADGGR